jgi:hypothetical protein
LLVMFPTVTDASLLLQLGSPLQPVKRKPSAGGAVSVTSSPGCTAHRSTSQAASGLLELAATVAMAPCAVPCTVRLCTYCALHTRSASVGVMLIVDALLTGQPSPSQPVSR